MKISKTIRKRLLKDLEFRQRLALELKITEGQIRRLANDTKSENNKLTTIVAVNFFKANNYSESQILETVKLSKSA